jgi:hypothetical protein
VFANKCILLPLGSKASSPWTESQSCTSDRFTTCLSRDSGSSRPGGRGYVSLDLKTNGDPLPERYVWQPLPVVYQNVTELVLEFFVK